MTYLHHSKLIQVFLMGLLLFLLRLTIPHAHAELIQLEPNHSDSPSYSYVSPTTGEMLTATPVVFDKNEDGSISNPRPLGVEVLASLNGGGLQHYSIGLGVWIGYVTKKDYDYDSVETTQGAVIEIEPGVGGIRVHAGYGSLKIDKLFFTIPLLTAWDIKTSYYHTWSKLDQINANENYLGVTGDFMLAFVKLSVGAYYHVAGSPDAQNVLLDANLGLVLPF